MLEVLLTSVSLVVAVVTPTAPPGRASVVEQHALIPPYQVGSVLSPNHSSVLIREYVSYGFHPYLSSFDCLNSSHASTSVRYLSLPSSRMSSHMSIGSTSSWNSRPPSSASSSAWKSLPLRVLMLPLFLFGLRSCSTPSSTQPYRRLRPEGLSPRLSSR